MKFKTLLIFMFGLLLTSSLHARGEKSTDPATVYKGCAKCHGKDGKNTAFGRSEELAGQDVEDLIESIQFFVESSFGQKGVIKVMSKQVKHLNEEQIEELAVYISNLGKDK